MAVETPAVRRGSAFVRRFRERVGVWRRLFLMNWALFKASRIGVIGLAIMVAFLIIALAAPFMGLRDPIRWQAPDEDLISVAPFWVKDNTLLGSEFRTIQPINQPIAMRILPNSIDPRADRLYVAATTRLYALETQPSLQGENAWRGTLFGAKYFNVTQGTVPNRTISAPPILMNYGSFTGFLNAPADYEIYVGTSDGALFILRDTDNTVPTGTNRTAKLQLDGAITGLAAYTHDDGAPPWILGSVNLLTQNGTRWDRETIADAGDTGDLGEYASLAFNGTGAPYVAYYDFALGQPALSSRAGTRWTADRWEPFNEFINTGQFTSLAIGSDGIPQIAYYDAFTAGLRYAFRNSTGGYNASTIDAGGVGQYASLALNQSNVPRIAYWNATSNSLKYATGLDRTGANWTLATVDGNGGGRYASLALNATEAPRIVYYSDTNGSLQYAFLNGSAWTVERIDSGTFQDVSLALDPGTGEPAVAYYAVTARALKFANRTTAWNPPISVDGGGVGRNASLAFNGTGKPASAYLDEKNWDLKFAQWSLTSGWTNRTILSAGHVGLYASLKFDSSGRALIAYRSFETGRTSRDVLVAGTAKGKLYGIDVSVPNRIVAVPPIDAFHPVRHQKVDGWDYRLRWEENLGSAIHLANSPMRGFTAIPAFSPAFNGNGTAVYVGTDSGNLFAQSTLNGTAYWASPVFVGAPWNTAPIVELTAEGPRSVKGHEIVYAASSSRLVPPDNRVRGSFLYARYAWNGTALPEWAESFAGFGGAGPVGPTLTTFDGGNLTQPTVEGIYIYVGSDTGYLYALRRDETPPNFAVPLTAKWSYVDPKLVGFHPRFTGPPLVLPNKGILLTVANEDNGTATNPADDHGVLYSITMSEGGLAQSKTFPSVAPGMPLAWDAPKGLGLAVFVAYGGPTVVGVSSLAADGRFLAPSEPSWAHTYACPPPAERRCPGYPSGNQYWLGLDNQGRDIFSQVIWGSRIALLVGFMSAILTVVLGVVVGLLAGYVGGKTESVLMRFTDVILVLPGLPLIITLAAVLGASIWNIILVISLLGWPGIARIIRAEVLSLKERPFIDSARVTGASTTRIVFKHIAPNVMPLAFLYMTFSVSGAILTEAALSFIGLGDASTMSWGIMLQLVSQSKALESWWWLLPPGLAITLISLAFFLVGRAFDEIVNPRLRKR